MNGADYSGGRGGTSSFQSEDATKKELDNAILYSSFDYDYDDNSATLPRRNTSHHGTTHSRHGSNSSSGHGYEGTGSTAGAIVELSSLFKSESSLFRSNEATEEAKGLLVEREKKRRNYDKRSPLSALKKKEEGHNHHSQRQQRERQQQQKEREEQKERSRRKRRGRKGRRNSGEAVELEDVVGTSDREDSSSSNNNDNNNNTGTTRHITIASSSTASISNASIPSTRPTQPNQGTDPLRQSSSSNSSSPRKNSANTNTATNTDANNAFGNFLRQPSWKGGLNSLNSFNASIASASGPGLNSGLNSIRGGLNSINSLTGGVLSGGLNNEAAGGEGRELMSSLTSIREEGSDEEDEDPLMEVMDYLEDEIDEHTYDDLIPLQIRMALEDQVFGWDHFFSNILGHVGFTVGSYLLTFWIITFVVLHELPWGNHIHDGFDDGLENGGVPTGSAATTTPRSNNPWGMPHELFSFVRTALSLGSAISTFRTIRRRRRVWLRQPYGTSAPGSREARRQQSSLEEADRRAQRFVLGSKLWAKMQRSYTKRRNKYLARGVHRKLLKAQKMFERRHRNRVKLIRSTSASSLIDGGSSQYSSGKKKSRAVASALTRHGHEHSHHERVRMLASTPGSVTSSARKRLDSDTLDGTATDDGYSVDGTSSSVGGGGSVTGDDPADYQSFVPPAQYAMDSHTLPNFAMESVSHDQMPFSHGEIKRIPYVHGGFFGAAPFMLTNPHWIAILRILMPDVYVEISRRASYAPAPRLIHWAENNPVVAAYGTAHEIEFSGRVPTLEWDVFLDPYLVRRVEIVLSEKEAFLQRQKDARKKGNDSDNTGDDNDFENESSSKKQTNPAPINATDERLVLSYYDKEIKRRTTLLVERMLIAHGNIVQLMMEQIGYLKPLKKYNFSRVKRTRKTLGGGIFARQWLAVYSEAMKLGMGYNEDIVDDDVSDSGTDGSLEERVDFDFADFSESKDGMDQQQSQRDFTSPESKSAALSLDAGVARLSPSPLREDLGGPPRKIIMMRSNDECDDGMSTDGDGSINSEPSPQRLVGTPRMGASRRKRRGGSRMTPTPTASIEEQANAATSLHMMSIVPDKSISESISILKPIMQCSAPFGIVLDMKSRHVPRRVWALCIDFLRDCGARVEGIASFIVEEVRDISQYCSSSVNEIVFIHSAGDLQHGCHTGQIRRGDKVFFNAGSLLWDYPDLYDVEVVKNILWHRFQPFFDEQAIKEGYRLKPYAKVRKATQESPRQQIFSESETETCDESTLDDGDSVTSDLFARLIIADSKKKDLLDMEFAYEEAPNGVCSTIQEYKQYYNLSIGLYVQEFAIDEVAISLIVKYVNKNLSLYNLGLSWGGINGLTVKGIQPGRFTATDGLWNQRYGGMPWNKELKPGMVMTSATPEVSINR